MDTKKLIKERGIAYYLALLSHDIRKKNILNQERFLVRRHMLDAIVSAFYGFRNPVFKDVISLCLRNAVIAGQVPKEQVVLGPLDTSMIWSFAVNSSVFEDGTREGACHPAAAVLPVVIAFSAGKSWEIIDKAVIAGYDAMERLARCGNPGFKRKGYHPTSIVAPFGAAVTASVLNGYDAETTKNALCLAALTGAGLMAAFNAGETEPLQVALAVRNGLTAALLAGSGHAGYDFIIEEGFFPAYLGTDPYPTVDHPLEFGWAIKGSYFKLYPGFRHLHPTIDAFDMLINRTGLFSEQIQEISVGTYMLAVDSQIKQVKTRGDAYFNIPFVVAARAVEGELNWNTFDEKYISDDRITQMMRKVTVHIDKEIDSLFPSQKGSHVSVRSVDGNQIVESVTLPFGEPENPIPEEVMKHKIHSAFLPYLTHDAMKRIEGILTVPEPKESGSAIFDFLNKTIKTTDNTNRSQ